MDSDQKFVRKMLGISVAFAVVMTLGVVAMGYLLGGEKQSEKS